MITLIVVNFLPETRRFLLCLNNISLAMFFIILFSIEINMTISHYVSYLKHFYSGHNLMSDEFPFINTTVYVELALIKTVIESNDDITYKQYQGQVDQILAVKEKIEVKDILKEDTRLAVIEGAPGMGKSTLAWEICRNWDQLDSLKRFWLVLFLRLREEEVQLAKDIKDLLYHPDEDLSSSVGKEVKKREGQGVLFVFDGFDEFPTKFHKKSLVMKLISNPRYLPKATMIVTSRPSALADLQQFIYMENSRHIEIIGFAKKEILKYASQRLAGRDKRNFTSYLSLNPAVEGMMYNPLHCAIVLEIYLDFMQSDRPIIHTQTQLYTELVFWLMSRHLAKENHPLARHLPDKLEELRDETDIYQQLVKIGKLAFEGLQREQIIFKKLPKGCSSLGLMMKKTKVRLQRERTQFIFFHSTLQEFMSAFYVSQLSIEVQKNLFQNVPVSIMSMWIYVAGLTKTASIGWGEFTGDSLLPEEVNTSVIQCIYEAQDLNGCHPQIYRGNIIEYSESDPSDYSLFALGYSIRICGGFWMVSVEGKVSDNGFKMLGLGIQSVTSNLPLYIGLGTQCSPCGTHIKQLLQMPSQILRYIQSLVLFQCFNYGRECINYHGTELRIHLESVTVLTISSFYEEHLCYKREHLYMIFTMLEADRQRTIKNIHQLFKTFGRSYNVSKYILKFPKEHCQLVREIMSLSSLHSLTIKESYTTSGSCGLDPFRSISNSIAFIQYREDVSKNFNQIVPSRPQGVSIFTNILMKKPFLKNLTLHFVMTRDEVRDLVSSLKGNKKLERLVLSTMYHQCFSLSEIRHMDPRVAFKPSTLNFNHTRT